MAKEKTKAYVVTQTGMQNPDGGEFEVGTTINLTEAQAAARVGKVVLKSEAGAPAPAANSKLVDTVTEQAGQIAELTDVNTELTTTNTEQAGQITSLTQANTDLGTQVEALTKTNAELTKAAKVKAT